MRKKMKSFQLFRDKKAKGWRESLQDGESFFQKNKQAILLFLLGLISFPVLFFLSVSLREATTSLVSGIMIERPKPAFYPIANPTLLPQKRVVPKPVPTSATINVPSEKPKVVGGDKDEHGCYLSAGYTWCQAKNKCLRTWEEPCSK